MQSVGRSHHGHTNSSANIFACWEICDFGGMINEIMLVPLPRLHLHQHLYIKQAHIHDICIVPFSICNLRLFKALDQLFDLPYFDVLLRLVRLRGTHIGGVFVSKIRLSVCAYVGCRLQVEKWW
jgi:hypothetical protein